MMEPANCKLHFFLPFAVVQSLPQGNEEVCSKLYNWRMVAWNKSQHNKCGMCEKRRHAQRGEQDALRGSLKYNVFDTLVILVRHLIGSLSSERNNSACLAGRVLFKILLV